MARTLHQLLQSLPQELYDHIFDFTFTKTPPHTIKLTASYQPPTCLQVSHHTRQTFAEAYYQNTTFELREGDGTHRQKTLFRWLATLPRTHRRHLSAIEFHAPEGRGLKKTNLVPNELKTALRARRMESHACRFLRAKFGEIGTR